MILDATGLPALKAFFGWSIELKDEMSFLYRATPRVLDVFCYYVDHCQLSGN